MTIPKIEIIIIKNNVEATISPTNRFGTGPRGGTDQEDRSTDEVGRFLVSIRFESRGKMEELVTEGDKTT